MQVLKYSSDFNLWDYSSSRLHAAVSAAAAAAVVFFVCLYMCREFGTIIF
jgi:hypothetical protein